MKHLVCEMCGSTELVKQDGIFVCQFCGAKYSVEEAKKMMVEIDNTKKMTNLYERARKSLEVDDLQHAAEYYKQILDENPNDWEAYFYSYLGEFTTYTNAQAGSVADKLGSTIPAAYEMAIKDCDTSEAATRMEIISNKTTARLIAIAIAGASLLREYEGGSVLSVAGNVQRDMYSRMRPTASHTIISCILALEKLEDKLKEVIAAENGLDKEKCKECLLTVCRAEYELANMQFKPDEFETERLVKDEAIQEYAEKIHELDPSFEIPETKTEQKNESSSGGCYVATAVYGSYDCPQVWTLRRYRDTTLASTWYGRTFIHTYYAISPTLVKWFGDTVWFKKMWQGKLDRMVSKLQSEGVECTPYEDKTW